MCFVDYSLSFSEPEQFKFDSKFDELFNNYQIETHIYDSETDEKSPTFDIEDLPLPYYGTYHTADDSNKEAVLESAEDPLQSLFPYYNNSPPVATEIEFDTNDVDSTLNTVNILQGSFVIPETSINALADVPEIKEAVEPQSKNTDDNFLEFLPIQEVPISTQSFELPILEDLADDIDLSDPDTKNETKVLEQKELTEGSFVLPVTRIEPLVDVPEIEEAVERQSQSSDDEISEFLLIPEVPSITQSFEPPKLEALTLDDNVKLNLAPDTPIETIVMDQKELTEVLGKDENEQILEMIMKDGIEIIEIEQEAKNVSFFEMDKDTETSSRGDRDLSEEMIRIEDHILLPFYDL